jgi:Mitochondrial carrier protein
MLTLLPIHYANTMHTHTQFMMFDTLKRLILAKKSHTDPHATRLTSMESLISGSFAGALSAFVTYPLDLARAR